jgi:hypothetical protein
MEDQMESKFQAAIENNTNHFDRIHSDLELIKKNNTKSKRVSRKKKAKKDDVHSVETKDGTGEDVGSQFEDLLQNPMIQSLLSMDLSRIGDLLQNPRIQSLFADSKDNKNDKSRNKREKGNNFSGSSGLDLSWIRNLLQNPMVQSLLKSQMNKKMIG